MTAIALLTFLKSTFLFLGIALVSVQEQIESFESVSDPLLNSLNPLPFCPPLVDLGAQDVDGREPMPL
jgi:tetrahydromethanopterin S-methyltransferase subunit B